MDIIIIMEKMTVNALTFHKGSGNPLIYIDSPEAMCVAADTRCFLYERPLDKALKEVEMYCIVYNGDSSASNALNAGIVFRNTNSSPVNISYIARGDCQKHGTGDSNYASEVVAPNLNSFFNVSSFSSATIPANGYYFLNPIAGKTFVAANAGMFITVRIRVSASVGSGITMRMNNSY